MNTKKDVPLKIELFSNGDDSQFRIYSKKEILSLLNSIARAHSRVALYYGEGNFFILTALLGVNEEGVWVDASSLAEDNQHILRSKKIIFVSSHQQVKVQFVSQHIKTATFNNSAAFQLPLPDNLLRIQRRDYFRLTVPANIPLRCIIPVTFPAAPIQPGIPASKREVTIMDISVGGVALVCEEYDTELQPGKIYPDCSIPLPDMGSITATIKVKSVFEITLRNGQVNKRVGCEFIHLSGDAAALLQRYITHLQSKAIVKT